MISKILNFVYNSGQQNPSQELVSELRSGLVNLGCGNTFHPDWDNFDLVPTDGVRPLNLLAPLPFAAESARACYSSHVLEHISRSYAPKFLAEIFRVLMPGGVVRIVVPDLEQITRLYLRELEAAVQEAPGAVARHEWMTIELLDQLTRTFSGGFMGKLWKSRPLKARGLIMERLGREAGHWIEEFDGMIAQGSLRALAGGEVYDQAESAPEELALFRGRGEIHLWMYDRVSLGNLLRDAGFSQIKVCSAKQSGIPFFESYHLDRDPEGRIRKPDSLFMEGVK
jgi:predicted SAM-dependent methyltransferase